MLTGSVKASFVRPHYFNNCGVETVDASQGIYKIGSFENDYRDFRYDDVYMEGATSLLVQTSKHMSRPLNMRVYVDSVSEENMVGEVIGLERYMTDSTGTNPNEHFAYYEIELNRTLTGTHQLIITTVPKGEIPEGINSNNEHIFAVKLVNESAPTDPEATEPEATEPEATEPDNGASVKAEAIEGNVAIDGKLDEAFWTVQGTLEKQTGGQNIANTVTFGTAWDDTYLFVGANVIDATVFGTSDVNHWDNDAIEVFIDGNNDKGGAYDAHDVQYLVAWGKDTLFSSAAGKDEGVLWAIEGTDEGYVVEMAVPWAVLDVEPELGMEIGFDVVNDDRISADGVRVGSLTWAGDGNNYASTKNFGTLVLVDDIEETQPTEPEATEPEATEPETQPTEPTEPTTYDVAMAGLWWSPWEEVKLGEGVVFRGSVHNNGKGFYQDNNVAATVNFYVNDNLVSSYETKNFEVRWRDYKHFVQNTQPAGVETMKWFPTEEGTYTIKAELVMPGLEDTDLTNNVIEKTLVVAGQKEASDIWMIDDTDTDIKYAAEDGSPAWLIFTGDAFGDHYHGSHTEVRGGLNYFQYTFTGAASFEIIGCRLGFSDGSADVYLTEAGKKDVKIGSYFTRGGNEGVMPLYSYSGLDPEKEYTLKVIQTRDSIYLDGLKFYKEDLHLDENTDLLNLTVNGVTIAGFDPTVTEYTYEVAFGTTKAPTIVATPFFSTAKATVAYPDTLDEPAVITVTSGNGQKTATYTINFTVAGAPDPVVEMNNWQNFESWYLYSIGGGTEDDKISFNEGVLDMQVKNGSDIWGKSDKALFSYANVSGDVRITARVVGPKNGGDYTKAAIMLRDGLDPAAPYVATVVPQAKAGVGIRQQWRSAFANDTEERQTDTELYKFNQEATWIRLERKGNNFTSYASMDGEEWILIGEGSRLNTNIPTDCLVGFVLAGNQGDDKISQATFDNVTIEPILPADKTALVALIDEAGKIDLTAYTNTTANALRAALASAKNVNKNNELTSDDQAVVEAAITKLQNAIDALVEKADTSELVDLVDSVKDTDLSGYTDASGAVFSGALAAAQELLKNKNLSKDDQAAVDSAVADLEAAFEALETKPTEPEATEPEATEPEATEPEATEPEATEPEATEPEATEPEATEPEATEPEATEPEETDPAQPTVPTKPSNPDSPSTGDSIFFWIPVFVVTLMAAAALVWVRRRQA